MIKIPFSRAKLLAVLLCAGLLSACQTAPQTAALKSDPPGFLEPAAQVADLPFFPQELYHCGPAALATVLRYSGIEVVPDDLVSQVYVPGRQGSFQIEMMAAARSRGRLVYRLAPSMEDLLAEVDAGNPVLVFQNLGLQSLPQWHFAVVKGYDLPARELILNSGTIENYRLRFAVFERTWARGEHWAITVTRPDNLPATAKPDQLFQSLAALEHSHPDFETLGPAYISSLQRWPGHRDLLMGYGNLQLQHDDFTGAGDSYQRVLTRYPEFAPAHNNLAHVYLETGELERAAEHARSAVRLGDRFVDIYRETLREVESAMLTPRLP